MGKDFTFVIDVIGSCNLRCPSCPVGNSQQARQPSGLMSPDLLERIIAKAVGECDLGSVSLYNWTEPLLHPQLAELVEIVARRGVNCLLSSNLNVLKNIDAVLSAGPRELRISVSGFHQETYGTTHVGGQIQRVKENMVQLADARRRTRSKTKIRVAFHRYLHNFADELAMRSFAESLGFDFQPLWALLMPLEKNLAYLGETCTDATITEQDQQLIDRLALHPGDAAAVGRRHREQPCVLQDQQMALDFEGYAVLCCGVFDRQKYRLAAYLDTPLDELQALKKRHSLCGSCMSHGLHVVGMYGTPELDEVAMHRIRQHDPEVNVYPISLCAAPKPRRGMRRAAWLVKQATRKAFHRLAG